MPALVRDDKGVSVIVGALLLILITVIAAAGLAMIVSQAEKQQADRQAQEDAIKNENLKIVAIKPTYDSTGKMTKIDVTVQNINIDDAKIGQVSLNNNYAGKYHSGSHDTYDTATEWLTIPASKSAVIELGMNATDFQTPPVIKNTDPIKIQVSTSYYNFFDNTFKPPTASAKFDVETENLGIVQRDYVMLDASDSDSNAGQIKVYQWDIKDGSDGLWNPIPGDPIVTSGSKIRFTPPSNGPFKVTLTVKDDQNDENAMAGTTQEMDIPADPNFCPPLTLSTVYYLNNTTILATLRDASGNPCPNKVVTFQPGSNILVNQTMALTDASGVAAANVSFIGTTVGTVTVSYEKLTGNVQVSALAIPPTAGFNAYSTTPYSGDTVQFADTSDRGTGGSITAWQWDFGDGNTSTLENPTHVFTNLGSYIIRYTIQLIVTNSAGTSAPAVKTDFIAVRPNKPVPDFIAIVNGSGAHTVDFSGSYAGGMPYSWTWDFGDGRTGSSQTATHLYASAGNYTVKLTAQNDGGSNQISKNISVG